MSQNHLIPPADILALAIRREIAAAEGYTRMAKMAETPGLQEMLLFLGREEEAHRRLLEGLTDDMIQGLRPALVPDLQIVDRLEDETLSADMSLQDLLIFAVQKEKKAIELYASLAGASGEPGSRRLFEFLAAQERDHKLKLEAAYEQQFLREN